MQGCHVTSTRRSGSITSAASGFNVRTDRCEQSVFNRYSCCCHMECKTINQLFIITLSSLINLLSYKVVFYCTLSQLLINFIINVWAYIFNQAIFPCTPWQQYTWQEIITQERFMALLMDFQTGNQSLPETGRKIHLHISYTKHDLEKTKL